MGQIQKYDWAALYRALKTAYREACLAGDCDCVTIEEHERRIATAPKAQE